MLPFPTDQRLRIAVIGGGVAGITTAHILSQKHAVTLFEGAHYVGGHTNTVVVDKGPDEGLAVDTGFIVCNDKTYPNFHRLLRSLRTPVGWADMSFGFWDERSGLQYAGTTLDGLFAQRANLLSPRFLGMLWEIGRFSRQALRDLDDGRDLAGLTLGEYLKRHGFSRMLTDNYIVPMGAAIWSTAANRMLDFPAHTFIHFFRNHGLLKFEDRPRWQTVIGGSQSYVQSFLQRFPGEVQTESPVRNLERRADGVDVRLGDGRALGFDAAVLAVHADQVLPILGDATAQERRLFGAWSYEKNRVALHTWRGVLPPNRRAWASWNYVRERTARPGGAVSMTYHMNRLQGFATRREYCVTLNRRRPIEARHIIREIDYTHPLYTRESIAAQDGIAALNGTSRVFFAGSYLGYGFHEDATKSGVEVGRKFGLEIPA